MQSWYPQRLPLQCYLYRVVREDRFLVKVALIQANAPAVSNVYGGDDFYNNLPYRLILEYFRHGRARNALLSLFLFSRKSSALFITFLVSLGIIISSV